MPHTHGRFAHELFQRVVVGEHVVQGHTLHHQGLDQIFPQCRGTVEKAAQDIGDEFVFTAVQPDLADLVAIARRERIVRHGLHDRRQVHGTEPADAVHHPFEVALIR